MNEKAITYVREDYIIDQRLGIVYSNKYQILYKDSNIFSNRIYWDNNRLLMAGKFLFSHIFILIGLVILIRMLTYLKIKYIKWLYQLFIILMVNADLHELVHALSYRKFNKHYNGILVRTPKSFEFVYNSETVTKNQEKVIQILPTVLICLLNTLLMIKFNYIIIFLIATGVQIINFFAGNDYKNYKLL